MPIVKVTKNTYIVEPLYQWDLNQQLVIYGLSLASVPEIHFANAAMDRAIVRQASMDAAGVVRVDVPNSLLQKPYTIKAYVCTYAGATFETQYKLEIPVKARNKPADYTLEDDPEVYSFNALENQVLNLLDEVTAATNTANAAKTAASSKLASFNGRTDSAAMPQSGDYTAAMVGAAPAGYGLGGAGKLLNDTHDLNNVWECGYYYWQAKKPVNAPATYCTMTVSSLGKDRWVQEITVNITTVSLGAYGNMKIRRIKFTDTIIEEYENPPMKLGVEYRTTERYNCKPVYCKYLNCGSPAETTKTPIGEENLERVWLDLSRSLLSTGSNGTNRFTDKNFFPNMYISEGEVIIKSSADVIGAGYLHVVVWYTKTTD